MSELDHYDVEAMIRDALIDERREWVREVDSLRQELRDTHAKLEREITAVERVLASRTEHLV